MTRSSQPVLAAATAAAVQFLLQSHSSPPIPRPADATKPDKTFQNLTESSLHSENHKTNPPPPAAQPSCNKIFQNPTESSLRSEKRKTNPPPRVPATELSTRQLLAIRWLLEGHRPTRIAAALDIARQTLAAWRRNRLFRQHLLDAHLELLKATVPPQTRRMSDAEYRVFAEDLCRRAGRPLGVHPSQWTNPIR